MKRCYTAVATLLSIVNVHAQNVPVLHWTLDETDGTVAHEINNTANAILQEGVLWDPEGGHHQGACRFDGIDDRIILGPCDLTSGGGEISLSLWVKPDFVTAMERTIITKSVGPAAQDHIWSLAFVNASSLRFRLRTGATTVELSTPPSSVFSGTWYHIVGAYDGAAMRIYLNGSLMAETSTTGSMGYHPEAPASIAAQSTGTSPFSGWVDDVRIYDQGLSQQEVIDILLEDELTTGISGDAPWLRRDGSLQIPAGPWTELQLLDAAGRSVSTHGIADRSDVVDLRSPPAGLYLVCLQGKGRRSAWPLVIP